MNRFLERLADFEHFLLGLLIRALVYGGAGFVAYSVYQFLRLPPSQ